MTEVSAVSVESICGEASEVLAFWFRGGTLATGRWQYVEWMPTLRVGDEAVVFLAEVDGELFLLGGRADMLRQRSDEYLDSSNAPINLSELRGVCP